MLQQILVPFDYSAPAEAALLFAADLARTYQAKLLVHYFVEIEVHLLGDYPVIKGDPIAEETERLRTHVQRVLADVGQNPAYEVEVAWGSPFIRIVETAIERKTDLVVMGTHGWSGIKHVLLGSVAERTVRLAPCPVLTLRGPANVPGEALEEPARRAVDAGTRHGEVAGMMTPRPITIGPGESLETARDRMSAAKIRHLPVIEAGRLVGILSDVDLPGYRGQLAHTRVHVAMTPDPITIAADARIDTAARLMLDRRVRALPVVEGEQLIGMLSATDILEDYIRASRTRS
jgi:CBS domain-containing protein/nucleotide-binding universal stress UspA family protein